MRASREGGWEDMTFQQRHVYSIQFKFVCELHLTGSVILTKCSTDEIHSLSTSCWKQLTVVATTCFIFANVVSMYCIITAWNIVCKDQTDFWVWIDYQLIASLRNLLIFIEMNSWMDLEVCINTQ